jgi:hypothetical protein
MVKIGSSSSLFFSVNCVGIDVTYGGCLNLRHICEMGVNIDETDFDVAGNVIRASDCIIGSNVLTVIEVNGLEMYFMV